MADYDIKSPIGTYLKEISKVPLLTKEEEYSIAKNIIKYSRLVDKLSLKLKNDPENKELNKQFFDFDRKKDKFCTAMIMGNCRLVVSIAKRYSNNRIPLSDLVEEGNIGLMKAVNRYDPERGVRFSTFATWWIRQKVLIYINKMGNYIRLPSVLSDEIKKIKRLSGEFKSKHGVEPTVEQLKELTAFSTRKLKYIQSIPTTFVSLNIKLHGSEQELVDRIVSEYNYQDPEDIILDSSMKDLISSMLSRLNNKEKEVICMRYGLNGYLPMVLERVGSKLSLTRERVRQIQAKALNKLRLMSVDTGLQYYFLSNHRG